MPIFLRICVYAGMVFALWGASNWIEKKKSWAKVAIGLFLMFIAIIEAAIAYG